MVKSHAFIHIKDEKTEQLIEDFKNGKTEISQNIPIPEEIQEKRKQEAEEKRRIEEEQKRIEKDIWKKE